MPTVNIDPDNVGMNDVRNFGMQLKTLTGTFDFDSSYDSGGEEIDLSSYFTKETYGVIVGNQDGYVFEYDPDNEKIKAYKSPAVGTANLTMEAAGQTLTVADQDTPDGNAIHVAFTDEGEPYLECNMATDTADKYLDFGDGIKVKIFHNGSVSSNQVYLDEDGNQPDRLLADLSGSFDTDVFIETTMPGYYVKIVNDASAATNGVAVNYDDDTDERLEAETDGDADADIDLASNVVTSSIESADTLVEESDGADLSSVTNVKFFAYGI